MSEWLRLFFYHDACCDSILTSGRDKLALTLCPCVSDGASALCLPLPARTAHTAVPDVPAQASGLAKGSTPYR